MRENFISESERLERLTALAESNVCTFKVWTPEESQNPYDYTHCSTLMFSLCDGGSSIRIVPLKKDYEDCDDLRESIYEKGERMTFIPFLVVEGVDADALYQHILRVADEDNCGSVICTRPEYILAYIQGLSHINSDIKTVYESTSVATSLDMMRKGLPPLSYSIENNHNIVGSMRIDDDDDDIAKMVKAFMP